MSKNKQVMSIAIVPELKDELTRYARRKGMSASAYIGNLVEQAVKLNIDDDPIVMGKPIDEDVLPVVLKVPSRFRHDKESLEQWLNVQVQGIVKAMTKA